MIADAELVQRCRHRDANAFGELVERHQRLVFGVALARCGDAALAEDLAQDAFVTAWRDLDRLRDDARVGTWVAGIARNLAASAARDRARRAAQPAIDSPAVPTPEDAALAREDRELLAHALADVPTAHREALVLFYLEGESIARIATALGITEDLVKQRLSRGRRALREGVASRIETALARVRGRPALRAGVLAALATATTRKVAAATPARKVFTMISAHKLVVAGAAIAIAALFLATRRDGDTAHAGTALPTALSPTAGRSRVRRIDPASRERLLAQIRAAEQRASDISPSAASAPTTTQPGPELAPGDEVDKDDAGDDSSFDVNQWIEDVRPLLRDCYEDGLQRDATLAGTIVVSYTIEGEADLGGVVTSNAIESDGTTLLDTQVHACIQDTLSQLEVDWQPGNIMKLEVSNSFEFTPDQSR